MKKTGIKISACMMVKNEEEMLPRCLNSIKHLIDELIVVDTGSTDKTVEIAESFGAKIYHHPWENNFSKHRNQSLSYATGDWILLIDADEELNAYQLQKNEFKALLAKAPKELNCYLIKVLDKNRQGGVTSATESIRIFRNRVGIKYVGIVHNRLSYSGKAGHLKLELFHYGYALSDEQMQAKYRRTSGLLFKRIEQDPDDVDAYFYLFQVHSEMDEKEKAIQYANRCLELIAQKGIRALEASFYYSLYYGMASAHLKLSQYDQAEAAVRKGLEVLPDEVDLYYELAAVGYFSGRLDLCVEGGQNYFRVVDEFRNDSTRAGTRFVFTTSKSAETTVYFWLMTGLISMDAFDRFLAVWENGKDRLLDKPGFQKELFTALEQKQAFEPLEPVASFLLNHLEKIHPGNHNMVLSFLLFYLKEKAIHENDGDKTSKGMFEAVAGRYLDTMDSYQSIPTEDAVILADFLLNKNLGKFFLELTLVLFERELSPFVQVIESNETIIRGYKKISEKQIKDRKGTLISFLCLDICKHLSGVQAASVKETGGEEAADPAGVIPDEKLISGQYRPGFGRIEPVAGNEPVKPPVLKKNKVPPVSIGLPVFNGGKDLTKAIDSILNQDFEDFELIISDNCSTDGTEDICRRYADQDSRITYTRWDSNQGIITNFQNVLGLARSKFFIFAQHDNTFYPEFLSACLKEYEADGDESYAIVFPQVKLIHRDGRTQLYKDPINAIQDSPVERYLHVLKNLDLTIPVLGMMRTKAMKTNKMFYLSQVHPNYNTLYGDHCVMTYMALRGKIKRIDQVLLNRKSSDYKYASSMEERTVKLINAIDRDAINEGITLYYTKIIQNQISVITYASISFSEKEFLIKETVSFLKSRFKAQMLQEIKRAVELVKKGLFFTTWAGQSLPEKTLDELPEFKRFYVATLSRELENALLVFPELTELRDALKVCRQQIQV